MIRIGVVGHGGRISGVIKHCLREVAPDIRVVGIVDPDEAGARSRLDDCDTADVTFYRSLDAMVRHAGLDALAIGTRCNLHAKYAVAAARYDLPLYLEKPVAINMRQAMALERAFAKSRCKVVVSFPLCVSPLCQKTRQLLDEGAVGEPQHILGVNYVNYGTTYWEDGYRNWDITQGLFLQKATHDLDYMSYLMDSPIVRVSAMANWGRVFGGDKPPGLRCSACDEADTCPESPEARKRNGTSWHTNDHLCVFSVDCGSPQTGTNEDCSSALIEFASGAHGAYTQVFFTRRDAHMRGSTISGYLGTVSFGWEHNTIRRVRHHEPFTDTLQAGEVGSHLGGDIELAHDFISLVRGKTTESRTGIDHGLRSVYACLAAKRSAETGKFVNVRQLGA